MIIYFSLLVALVGVLMYALCTNPKLIEDRPHHVLDWPVGVPDGFCWSFGKPSP